MAVKLQIIGCLALLLPLASAMVDEEVEEAVAMRPPGSVWASRANFACTVDVLEVKETKPASKDAKFALDEVILRDALPDAEDIEWAHVGQHFFSDLDGRNKESVLATPGGDMGEFILAMWAVEEVNRVKLNLENATNLLQDFVMQSSKVRFYHSTAVKNHSNLADSMNCSNLKLNDPPSFMQKELLEKLIQPEFVGSRHLNLMLRFPNQYGMPARLTQLGIQAFHQVMWDRNVSAFSKLLYVQLKGKTNERGLVNIEEGQNCISQGLAPLIAPAINTTSCNITSTLVNHPQSVASLRLELADFMAKRLDLDAARLFDSINRQGLKALATTVSKIMPGYGHFSAYIYKDSLVPQQQEKESHKPTLLTEVIVK